MSKTYKYRGKIYSREWLYCEDDSIDGDLQDLLDAIDGEDLDIYTTTTYRVGGEIIGTDDDLTEEDVVEALIDYGTEIVEV